MCDGDTASLKVLAIAFGGAFFGDVLSSLFNFNMIISTPSPLSLLIKAYLSDDSFTLKIFSLQSKFTGSI